MILTAEKFIKLALQEVIKTVVVGASKLHSMVLCCEDPEGLHLTLPTFNELLKEFNSHILGR